MKFSAIRRLVGDNRRKRTNRNHGLQLAAITAGLLLGSVNGQAQNNILSASNPSGVSATLSSTGNFDFNNPFFKSLGTNGRSCVTCHQPAEGWGVSAVGVQNRFKASNGTDPIFRAVDGANCPTNATPGDANAFSQLLNKGLIRIDRPLPANAQFAIQVTDDPYKCSTPTDISVYRRPLPSTNLRFLSAVMWDTRETGTGKSIADDLVQQAIDATLGHAQAAAAPDLATAQAIRDFESALYTAQVFDNQAGILASDGANGGPIALSQQEFSLGLNDPFGTQFTPNIFTLFERWNTATGNSNTDAARASIQRGEQLFNSLPIAITGVRGLNDAMGMPVIMGTCGTCHNAPNAGSHSTQVAMDIGLTNADQRTSDQPFFTLVNNTTGQVVQTTDPGLAMVTGQWSDIARFKAPVLRGLAARAPYFHNGSAKTLNEVVDFYEKRFNLNLSGDKKNDLAAFLATL